VTDWVTATGTWTVVVTLFVVSIAPTDRTMVATSETARMIDTADDLAIAHLELGILFHALNVEFFPSELFRCPIALRISDSRYRRSVEAR